MVPEPAIPADWILIVTSIPTSRTQSSEQLLNDLPTVLILLTLIGELIRLLKWISPEVREPHIEAPRAGALAVDTFFAGR